MSMSSFLRSPKSPAARLLVGSVLLLALAAGLVAVRAASSQARAVTPTRGHAVVAKEASGRSSFMTGLSDNGNEMFSNSLWKQLHTKIVRYNAPYDTAVRPYSLRLAKEWIYAAKAQNQQVLVAFYHSEYTPRKMPSVATYKSDVAKFMKIFPGVKQYEAWDEANRGNVTTGSAPFSSPSAARNAQYYQAVIRDCHPCTVVGLDVLDQDDIYPTLRYIEEFKREIGRLKTIMPTVWGLHNYSDVNRLESWRTADLVKALGNKVWLTETGGIVKFGGAFPNKNGSGLRRSAKVLKFMFRVAAEHTRIKRLYIYDWTGGNSKTRFDAGLMNAKDQPREGYVVVCRQLHAAKCNVKTVNN
jgi:hypothetical protein